SFTIASFDYGRSTAVDSLGRVIVAGYVANSVDSDFAVTRFTPAGALDTNFGGTGIVTIEMGTPQDAAYSVAVDSMDRVVLAGHTKVGSNSSFAVARLTPGGALDTSFDADGKQIIDFGADDEDAWGLAIDSLDRIVVAGWTYNGLNYDFAVTR